MGPMDWSARWRQTSYPWRPTCLYALYSRRCILDSSSWESVCEVSISPWTYQMSSKILSFLYPRLYGGYAFLKYGNVGRAIQDLTGAVVQSVPPSAPLLGGAVPRSTLLLAISAHVSTINFKSKIHVKPTNFYLFIAGQRYKTTTFRWSFTGTSLLRHRTCSSSNNSSFRIFGK